MLLIPKIFSPKLRKDLNKFSVDFESIWAEIKVNNRKTQNTIVLNVIHSPNKNKTDIFLEQLATNIDNAIVKGHNIILMGDYNINYLNSREKEKLDSILLPYHLEIQNKTEATRICKTVKTATLIDYFISDIYVKKTILCDTPILSDHFALCTILKEQTNPLKLVEKKKIYDRITYNKAKFLDDLKKANWSVIYQQNNANEMLESFTKIFTRVLQKHAPLKNVFIRNDKSCFARSQTWLKEKNKELQKECDSSLKSKNFKTLSELKQKLFCSSNSDFNKFYQSLVMSSNNSRKRWNLMNEIRISTRTRSHIYS